MKTSILHCLVIFSLLISQTNAQSQNLPSLAPVFGTNGNIDYQMTGTAAGAFAQCHALQPDGKLILGGYNYYSTDNSYITSLLRIDPICGKPDSTFGENGFVTQVFEQRTICNDIALQQDGKIVGCGLIAPSNAGSQQQAGVFRFNSDGSVDSTFNGQGYMKLALGNSGSCTAHKVFIDNQGKILVVLKGGSLANMSMAVYKFKSNGEPDSTYGENGQVVIPYNYAPNSNNMSAAMHSDSSITIVSQVGVFGGNTYLGVGKVDKDGVRDSTFNETGYREYPELDVTNSGVGQKGYDIAFLSDGRFIASIGKNISGSTTASLVAFLPNGDVDTTFGNEGIFSFAGTPAVNGGIAIDEEDRTLIFACNNWNDGPGAVLRVLPNGILDSSFGDNGLILAPYNATPLDYRKFNDGLILPNGDIFAYGRAVIGFAAARFSFNPAQDALPQIVQNGDELSTSGLGYFQWFLNGEEIPGATSNTVTISGVGSYTVSMGFDNCVFTSEAFEVLPTSVQDVNATRLKIRNNPTQDFIYIDNAAANIPWEVYNIEGRRVLSGTNVMDGKIDLRSITKGIYIVRCMNDFGVVNFKVVKQ